MNLLGIYLQEALKIIKEFKGGAGLKISFEMSLDDVQSPIET
jgi:hypothetical protein